MHNKERGDRVKAQRERYATAKKAWEVEKKLAKQQWCKISWGKPKLGQIEQQPRLPKL
ncbi:hypothetical protein BD311DRAFT_675084 [Dichomitus squalens]|uniref:Uncharacterized protein n=1 Tax=Dichomitus squalens TaxID=114155 RepID=A0A4Q9M9N7_9APHY|nr:hypothetical protein BD311DRAFT_675084 [Dichomitus squalens]